MNLTEVFERFPEHVDCINYLEDIRWGNKAHCSHCDKKSRSQVAQELSTIA